MRSFALEIALAAAVFTILIGVTFGNDRNFNVTLGEGWPRQTIEGYLGHPEVFILFGTGNKELHCVSSMVGYAKPMPLCFGGQGDYERAERLIGQPVRIKAVLVARGGESWWLVEDVQVMQ